ncbi:MAG: hypothetical protein U5K30_09395 [Acidimicrobiales bacterium]|nr:hypothetical protein [Acidimicrobiales bacterium]
MSVLDRDDPEAVDTRGIDDGPADAAPVEENRPRLPPTDDGPIRKLIDIGVVAASALFVFWQLHPDLIVSDSTPAGGDMGAHVYALGYLRDVLLADFRWSGWTPEWYAGFPIFHFYMVVPFLVMVVLNAGLTGAGALLPMAGSFAVSSSSTRWRQDPAVAAAAGGALVVTIGAGIWSGWGPGVVFTMMVVAAGVAVLAAWLAESNRARVVAALALVIALGGIALPYGAAFKVVSVAGVVAMPVSAYIFGRLARFPFPTPALLSVATLAFLFDKYFTIYGGNIASTMAGEFAFSISLALAIAYLGVVLHGLRTGTHRATAAVLLALVGLCHLIPAFFALVATAVFLVVHVVNEVPNRSHEHGSSAEHRDVPRILVLVVTLAAILLIVLGAAIVWALDMDVPVSGPLVAGVVVTLAIVGLLTWTRRGPADDPPADGLRVGAGRVWWLLSMGVVAALLAAWWVLPFYLQQTYLNDMGWGKIAVHVEGTAIWDWFTDSVWPELVPTDLRLYAALALVGAVLSVVFKHRIGTALVILGLLLATAFVFVPQGRLWNARLLPFWYLVVYFLAAVGVGEVARAMAQVFTSRPDRPARVFTRLAAPVCLLALGVFLGAQLRNLPGGETRDDGSYELLSFVDVEGTNFVRGWAEWNYAGYEGKDAYPEYRDIVTTMGDVGEERGCGMSLWEYSSDLNDYGTPMALMLLPHWTDGCIGSMEGLYFEASSTTPFHFLMQSELSAEPSRAQRDMPYRDLDVDAGVEHMQLMGVQYYLAKSAEATTAADSHPELTQIATSGPWVVYEVAASPMVEPLRFQPAVTTAGEEQHEWLCRGENDQGQCTGPALDWFQDPSRWAIALAASGPDDWQRVDPGQAPEPQPVEPAEVSDVEIGRDGISFTVDEPGSPVLVKQSYFPNWEASGAEGPYRVAPNLMVVVPTDTEVSLGYGRTGVDWLAIALTALGLGLLVVLVRAGPVGVGRLRDDDHGMAAAVAEVSGPTDPPPPGSAPPPPPVPPRPDPGSRPSPDPDLPGDLGRIPDP